MRYELIPPANLHSVWPDVQKGLARILEKSPERWLPEDVYTHIRTGTVQLYRAYEDAYAGFFITELKREPHTNAVYLNVWALFAEPDECLFRRANMQTVAKDRHREIVMWEMLKRENDDGSFDTNDVNQHQLVSYTTQFVLRSEGADKSKMSGGEWDNLSGQLRTALAHAKANGNMRAVEQLLPPKLVNELRAATAP